MVIQNNFVWQTISKLETDRDAFQATVNKYSEITNQQVKEIAQLKKSLKELGNKNGDRHNIQTANYNFPSNTSNIKEALQNVRTVNPTGTESEYISSPTKNCDIISHNYCMSEDKLMHTCMNCSAIDKKKTTVKRMEHRHHWQAPDLHLQVIVWVVSLEYEHFRNFIHAHAKWCYTCLIMHGDNYF